MTMADDGHDAWDGARLLDEVRAVAVEGLAYAESAYDRDRYERLFGVVSQRYAEMAAMPVATVSDRFRRDLGCATPKVGVDALISDRDGRVLLCERPDGTWCMPCGWVDPNEEPFAAAERETREETGLVVTADRLVGIFLRRACVPDAPHGSLHLTVRCTIIGGAISVRSHEIRAVAWLLPDDVPAWHSEHQAWLRAGLAVVGSADHPA
jgi:8-oxo-dGTP pyrophosphatase MutT (NUDIX family)